MASRPSIDSAMDAFGVAAVVTPQGGAAVTTTGIWVSPVPGPLAGSDFGKRDPRRVMALPRDVLPALPRGSTVVAAEIPGGDSKTWEVQGYDQAVEPDCWRVFVSL